MNELSENMQARTKCKISISTDIKIGTVEQEIANISDPGKATGHRHAA